ncbi:MTMRE protein, partial [Polypterus senegalus]
VEQIEKRCLELFGRNYKYSIIQNANGEVCGHYPRQIVFLEYESLEHDKDRYESTLQVSKLQDLVNRSKMARCRGRFVCPVILYNGKHICRSSTLAGWGELYGRTGYNYIFSGGSDDAWAETDEFPDDDSVRNGDSQLFDKVRGHDIKLLRYLSVRYICDLMVENKKVKFGLNVTSSEKVDKAQRYADFTLLSIPYPGCEFFKDYKDRDYTAEGLIFNWNQDYVDAPLFIPASLSKNLNIDWSEYQDGVIHSTLEPAEILYLTIAYDWFLFGHMLPDRLGKGEEVSIKDKLISERRDRGSTTSLSSDFSLITEDSPAGAANFSYEGVELTSTGGQTQAAWRKGRTSSPQTLLLNKPHQPEERLFHLGLSEGKSSSSSSSNQSENSFMRAGSSPLAVPGRRSATEYARSGSSVSTDYGSWQIVSSCGSIHDQGILTTESPFPFSFQDEGTNGRMCPPVPERQARLEAVREVFLAAYSATVGLKSASPSSSGAITGLLEQFARGVGLRGTNMIV